MITKHVFTSERRMYAFRTAVDKQLVNEYLTPKTEARTELQELVQKEALGMFGGRFVSTDISGPQLEDHEGYRMPLQGGRQDFLPDNPDVEYLITFVTVGPLTPWD